MYKYSIHYIITKCYQPQGIEILNPNKRWPVDHSLRCCGDGWNTCRSCFPSMSTNYHYVKQTIKNKKDWCLLINQFGGSADCHDYIKVIMIVLTMISLITTMRRVIYHAQQHDWLAADWHSMITEPQGQSRSIFVNMQINHKLGT